MTTEDITALEQIVDRTSIRGILVALSQIASEKEQHVNSVWGDGKLAKEWRKAELQLDRLACNMSM